MPVKAGPPPTPDNCPDTAVPSRSVPLLGSSRRTSAEETYGDADPWTEEIEIRGGVSWHLRFRATA